MRREIKFRAWDKVERRMSYGVEGVYDGMCCDICGCVSCFGNALEMEIDEDDVKIYEKEFGNTNGIKEGDLRFEIMQFTSLHDKNGKEIYEGDIFAFDDEVWESSYTSCGTEYDSWDVKNYAAIGFDEETARFDFVKYKYNENQVEADLHENHDLEFSDFVRELEVIGNIYENPELLNGE